MFEKLKNIKFSFKKKSKQEDLSESSLDDDIFSASDSGGEDFFSEPSFGAEGVDDTDEAPSHAGDAGSVSFADSSEEDISTPDRFGESSNVFSKDDLLKTSKVVKSGSTRRTLLLFVLFVVFAGYAAYAYILPQYYPDLLEELMAMIPGQESTVKKEAPKRVAVKKPAPTRHAPAKPAPSKPAPAKPAAEAKPATTAAPKPTQMAKAEPQPAAPSPAKEVPKAEPADALEPVKEEAKDQKPKEASKPAPAKVEAKPAAQTAPKAAEPAKPVKEIKKVAPAAKVEPPKSKAVTPPAPKPVVRKAKKDIKITRGSIPVSAKGYYLQVGVYIFKGNLKSPSKKIESAGQSPLVRQGRKVIKMNRLLVGEWGDFLIAEAMVKKLRRSSFSAELISKNERFAALIGSYYYRHMADKKRASLKKKGFDARIEKTPINMKVHHLLVGPFNTPEEADSVLDSLKLKGLKAVIIHKR